MFLLPVKLPVELGIWQVQVTRSYPKLFEETLEHPMKSADNWPVDNRKEAGHYSGLNENWRSKFLAPSAACSLHTARRFQHRNNKNRIAGSPFLACHQLWLQRPPGLVYLTNAQSLGDLAIR